MKFEPGDVAFAEGRLTAHPWRSFTQPLHLRDPARLAAMPRAIINCTATLATRPAETRNRWTEAAYVRAIDTGHDVMITAPAALAAMLLDLAGAC